MKKIKIFLASSKELKAERELFEIEIYRKCKAWIDRGIFLHLDIWEDLSARMSKEGSQKEYDKYVRSSDLFVMLAFTKVGDYTAEEFENAFGQFQATEKPFIYTYFKESNEKVEDSLEQFIKKLQELGHFYSSFADSNGLWNQFNKELERLEMNEFAKSDNVRIEGKDSIIISNISGSRINVNTGNTTNQKADKIYNIDKIDKADFS
jgi:hypothetical protein